MEETALDQLYAAEQLLQGPPDVSFWDSFFDPARIPLAIIAILIASIIGLITGPKPSAAIPFLWTLLDGTIGRIGDRLDRVNRARADLLFRGFLVTVFTLVLVFILGRIAGVLAQANSYGDVVIVALLTLGISSGALWRSVLHYYNAKEHNKTEQGVYRPIARTARIDLSASDQFGISRCAMGLLPKVYDKMLLAPLFWFWLGGMPFFFLHAAVAMLSWHFAKGGFTKGFGLIPAWLDYAMGIVPSMVAAVLLSLSTLITPTTKKFQAIKAWFSRKSDVPYVQGGMPMKLMAWTLNISLGGPVRDLRGSAQHNVWTGPDSASAKLSHQHLKRGLYLTIVAHIVLIAALCVLYIAMISALI